MGSLIGKLFPYVDDIVFMLTGERMHTETATQILISFITLLASILNAKLRLIPDALMGSLFIFVIVYPTVYNFVVYLLKVDEKTAHDYAFFTSIIFAVLLIMANVPVIVNVTSRHAALILSVVLLLLSFSYQLLFNILIKVAIIEIEKNRVRYLYPVVLFVYAIAAYGFLVLIYNSLQRIAMLL